MALVLLVVAAGAPEPSVVCGGVVSGGESIVQPKLAGVASVLPSASMARTANVCWPTARPVYCAGVSHSANAAPSSAHSNVESTSVAVKVNVALVAEVGSSGADEIVVSGGTATVHSCSAGVSSTAPSALRATTSKVWSPSTRPV